MCPPFTGGYGVMEGILSGVEKVGEIYRIVRG
jgi:hypothetical protein